MTWRRIRRETTDVCKKLTASLDWVLISMPVKTPMRIVSLFFVISPKRFQAAIWRHLDISKSWVADEKSEDEISE